jgi:DNA excision repair protein ERCC-2
MYSKITERIAAICSSVQGGVGVFLPSYAVLDSVGGPLRSQIERTTTMHPRRTLVVERPGLSNEDSEEMMNTFKSSRGCVLLAVQGGRFSEGEDFPGDEMDVSIVVGLPLPPPSPTMYAEYKQMELDRLDKHQAHMVLSLLPALRKAFQCAGRHVREPGKVGMVFFMDSRFAQQKIIDLMPPWLREDLLKGDFGPESVSSLTREFFSSARGR